MKSLNKTKNFREYNPTVGQTWMTRKNEKYTIIGVGTETEHPVLALDTKRKMVRFTREGFFIDKNMPHENDLVEIC
jgi:hypothetical protein